jgi:triacylglycerol esterase/lipase EstA (alpha/beta hydrolase family)
MLKRIGLIVGIAAVAASGLTSGARADPRLDVPTTTLRAALECPAHFADPDRDPVLLVHGTGLNADESWDWNYELGLHHAGYDWCAVTLPDRALGDIQVSAEYVVWALERIRALTHRKVVMISHSQGGMETRWALRWWRRARSDTAALIDLASPNHGILAADACADSGDCWPAVWQMASGSQFLKALNSVSETPGKVAYTQIYSRTDELVEPSSTAPLSGGANTANIAIQSICPARVVHHAGLLTDPVVWELVLNALSHPSRPASAGAVNAAACLQPTMPYVESEQVALGNAFLYGSAALAFAQHSGVASEPALAPYARGAG